VRAPGLAVVGTDTDVGKTVVTAGAVRWLRARGVEARAVKPCQTGHPPDDDAGFVRAACGEDAATCFRYLEPALAPAVAADQAGVDLDYESIRDGCAAALAEAEVGVIEGIGGLRVPLADGREVLDLVVDLALPALVVGRSTLGTLNHTALSVEALERRNVPVTGVVLNEFADANVAERTNPGVIAEMTDYPVTTIPAAETDDPAELAATVAESLSASVLPWDQYQSRISARSSSDSTW